MLPCLSTCLLYILYIFDNRFQSGLVLQGFGTSADSLNCLQIYWTRSFRKLVHVSGSILLWYFFPFPLNHDKMNCLQQLTSNEFLCSFKVVIFAVCYCFLCSKKQLPLSVSENADKVKLSFNALISSPSNSTPIKVPWGSMVETGSRPLELVELVKGETYHVSMNSVHFD